MRLHHFAILGVALAQAMPAWPQSGTQPPRITQPITLTYADLADLALPASLAAQVRVTGATPLTGPQAAGVPAGLTRFYVEADLVSLIRGPDAIPAQVRYLADVPNDANGRPARLKRKMEFLVLADPVPARPGELKLVSADAQLPWSVELGTRIRSLLQEAAAPGAAPKVIGVGKAFHVPGSLPGESETQLFLLAAGDRPISVSVLRRPGQAPTWAVALGDIIDEAAATPAPNTLLWYRLACHLPRSLPVQSVDETDAASTAAIRADYALVLQSLGPCPRTRARR